MTARVDHKRSVAATAAAELAARHPSAELWLEGPVAHGLAHAYSDVDLRVISAHGALGVTPSWLVDDTRVDAAMSTVDDIHACRSLLASFDVRRDDLATFRQVRAGLPALTRLRTAHRYTNGGWLPVLTDEEREVYRRWALADRVETVMSLTEDLFGMITDGHDASARIIWWQIGQALAGADAAAAGQPLLGDKWLPHLCPGTAPWSDLPADARTGNAARWFRSVQARLVAALNEVWPADFTDPGRGGNCPEAGWLPQRFTDGWQARFADTVEPLPATVIASWRSALHPHGIDHD